LGDATGGLNLHLAEIAAQIAPGAHAALLVDQAGWHLSGRLVMPPNHLDPIAGEMSGVQSAGKRLAVPTRQLAQTESSNPMAMSSTIAARRGTSLSINPGGSCPSDFVIGPMGPDQRVLV
jgi:hypothetical protein